MKLHSTYADVRERYPAEIKEIMRQLAKGKSVHRKVKDPKFLLWRFEWGTVINGYSFEDVVKGKARKVEADWDALSLEEKIKDEVKRTRPGLVGSIGRWSGYTKLSEVPHEVVASIADTLRRDETDDEAEEARLAKLTPEERAAEIGELLKKLGGMGGAVVVVPKKGK